MGGPFGVRGKDSAAAGIRPFAAGRGEIFHTHATIVKTAAVNKILTKRDLYINYAVFHLGFTLISRACVPYYCSTIFTAALTIQNKTNAPQ